MMLDVAVPRGPKRILNLLCNCRWTICGHGHQRESAITEDHTAVTVELMKDVCLAHFSIPLTSPKRYMHQPYPQGRHPFVNVISPL